MSRMPQRPKLWSRASNKTKGAQPEPNLETKKADSAVLINIDKTNQKNDGFLRRSFWRTLLQRSGILRGTSGILPALKTSLARLVVGSMCILLPSETINY